MSAEKRVALFAFVVMCVIMSSSTIATAVAPPGGQKYYVNGFVKSSSGVPIYAASVALYLDGKYICTPTTQSNGYFSGSTYQYFAPEIWTAVVSKAGYGTETKSVAPDPDGTTSMGTIYLTPTTPPTPPPTEPVINQVHETGQGLDNGVEYFVAWDLTSTQYELKFYWSEDNVIDEGDLYVTHTDGGFYYDESPLPMSWTDSEYWFKITARSRNAGGWSTTEVYGPVELTLKYFSIGDAYVSYMYPNSNFNNDQLIVNYCNDALIQFWIPHFELVKRTTLHVWCHDIYPEGHSTIKAYIMGDEWYEEDITLSGATDLYTTFAIDSDNTANLGSWDEWDVTTALNETNLFSIRLASTGGGVEYNSKEYWNAARRPHVVVEYWGAPQQAPPSHTEFIDDVFSDESTLEKWVFGAEGNPQFSWYIGGVLPPSLPPDPFEPNYSFDEGLGLLFTGEFPYASGAQTWFLYQHSLDIDGGFDFELKFGVREVYQPLRVEIGVIFQDDSGGTILDMQYRIDENLNPEAAYVQAELGGMSSSQYFVGAISQREMSFRIQRSSYPSENGGLEWDLTWYESYVAGHRYNPHTILDNVEDSSTVGRIKLYVRVTPYGPSTSFAALFDFARMNELMDLKNPNTVAPFGEPIEGWDFETVAEVYEGWDNGEAPGQEPYGSLYQTGDDGDDVFVLEDSHSWQVEIGDPGGRYWSLVQLLESDSIYLEALEGRYISFSVSANYKETFSKVHALIRYRTSVQQTEWTAVGSSWVDLSPFRISEEPTPYPHSWVVVGLRSDYALPDELYELEIRITGLAMTSTGVFSGFLDAASLIPFAERYWDPTLHSWNGESRGVARMTLGVPLAVKLQTGYQLQVDSLFDIESLNGYVISGLGIEWDVGGAGSADASANDFAEWDNQGLGLDDGLYHDVWNTICGFMSTPTGALGQKLLTGLALSYVFKGGEYAWAMSGIAGAIVGIGASMIFQPCHRNTTDPSSLGPGDYGSLTVMYGFMDLDVERAQLGVSLGWDVSGNLDDMPPSLRLTIYIQWGTPLDLYYSFTTTHTAVVTFAPTP